MSVCAYASYLVSMFLNSRQLYLGKDPLFQPYGAPLKPKRPTVSSWAVLISFLVVSSGYLILGCISSASAGLLEGGERLEDWGGQG